MAFINGTNGNDTIRTAAAGGSLGGLPDATDLDDTINGLGGDDLIAAGGGNDQVRGNDGNDTLSGGLGDDDIRGGSGTDQYFGGDGYDNLDFSDGTATHRVEASLATGLITDQFGNAESIGAINDIEALGGSGLDDILEGKTISGSVVMLYGQGGDDTLLIGSGHGIEVAANYSVDPTGIVADLSLSTRQVADGYGDHDTLVGINAVRGSRHDDTILGNDADNWFRGEAGNDVINGQGGFDIASYANTHVSTPLLSGITAVLTDGAGSVQDGLGFTDTLAGIEQISGTQLDDRIGISGSQAMTLFGNAGNDLLYAAGGDDTLRGGDGNDWLFGNAGTDTLSGDAGSDIIWAGAGDDTLSGGDGDDVLVGEAGNDTIAGNEGADHIRGQGGDDSIDAGSGNDRAQGGDGNDSISGGDGNDSLEGEAGDDMVSGDGGDDRISGGAGGDVLLGGAGNDTLRGEAGADRLEGGAGLDFLTGGADDDEFVLARLQADRDWITDFQHGVDRLEIDGALFGLAPGALDPSQLVVGTDPVASAPGIGTFLFDTDDGRLRFDADGSGPGWPPIIATLTGVTALSTSDFIVV